MQIKEIGIAAFALLVFLFKMEIYDIRNRVITFLIQYHSSLKDSTDLLKQNMRPR
ncbi:MAG TPA: hypothetical protein VFF27_04660 [Bacteroidia bacterium]|jgi:hypothetical protein|nr:hypothetical protein [Bacteroidia bacterium]